MSENEQISVRELSESQTDVRQKSVTQRVIIIIIIMHCAHRILSFGQSSVLAGAPGKRSGEKWALWNAEERWKELIGRWRD